MPMVCTQCSKENPSGNTFCGQCGAKLSAEVMKHGEEPVFSPIISGAAVFSEKELKILIEINRTFTSDSKSSAVIQDDIDKLFE